MRMRRNIENIINDLIENAQKESSKDYDYDDYDIELDY